MRPRSGASGRQEEPQDERCAAGGVLSSNRDVPIEKARPDRTIGMLGRERGGDRMRNDVRQHLCTAVR